MTTSNNNSSLKQVIESILTEHSSLTFVEGQFKVEVYVEHDDRISENQLKTISSADDKKQAFYDGLEEFVQESTDYTEDQILQILKENWPVNAESSYEGSFLEILDELHECVDYTFPYDHYLKQELSINFVIDTGDGNYDYTLNNFLSYNAVKNEKVEDESSLLWLVKQQGYKKSELNRLIRKGETQDSKFLTSVYNEGTNVTTHMNALTFFVKMTLEEYMDFEESGKSITFSKETPCGLYDPWNGAGGLLEIELEKDVTVPAKFAKPNIEGAHGYGVDSIYGMHNSFWKETVVTIKTA